MYKSCPKILYIKSSSLGCVILSYKKLIKLNPKGPLTLVFVNK